MSVKPLPSLRGRDADDNHFGHGRPLAEWLAGLIRAMPPVRHLPWRFIDDWWIELLLMLFIVGTMVYNHYN